MTANTKTRIAGGGGGGGGPPTPDKKKSKNFTSGMHQIAPFSCKNCKSSLV